MLDAAEQFLVLQFLIAEAHQRLERHLVAEPVLPGDLQHLGADVSLDEAEDVGVGAALHLREQSALGAGEEGELVHLREPGGQEGVREVEVAAAHHVRVDVPADLLRRLDGACIAGGLGLASVVSL